MPSPYNDYSFSQKATPLFDYFPFPSVPKENLTSSQKQSFYPAKAILLPFNNSPFASPTQCFYNPSTLSIEIE